MNYKQKASSKYVEWRTTYIMLTSNMYMNTPLKNDTGILVFELPYHFLLCFISLLGLDFISPFDIHLLTAYIGKKSAPTL